MGDVVWYGMVWYGMVWYGGCGEDKVQMQKSYRVLQNHCNRNVPNQLKMSCIAVVQAYCSGYYSSK